MRSVVVVLPASMWAMIPMLRVLASGNSRIDVVFSATAAGHLLVVFPRPADMMMAGHRPGRGERVAPARKVRVRLTGLFHLGRWVFTDQRWHRLLLSGSTSGN